jgi:hypothetical protein
MLPFYVGTGVVLALLVGGWFAWTPLRVWYWEREVLKAAELDGPGAPGDLPDPMKCDRPLGRLLDIGPPALPAVERLLAHRYVSLRQRVVGHVYEERSTKKPGNHVDWAVPLMVRTALADPDVNTRQLAVDMLDNTTEFREASSATDFEGLTRELRAWWESEGRAKYGDGGK